jgi:formylglycine-generating enzyme required for sulfatase activity
MAMMAGFRKKNFGMPLLFIFLVVFLVVHGFSHADESIDKNYWDENYWWTRIQSSLENRPAALLEFLRASVQDKSGAIQYLLQTRGPELFYPTAKDKERDFQRLILVTLKTYDLPKLKEFYNIPQEGSDSWIAEIFQKIFFIYSHDRRFCFELRERLKKASAWKWREGEEALRTISFVISAIDESELSAEFVAIESAVFQMGSVFGEPGREEDETLHRVSLTQDFTIQTTEVTQLQWYKVMENNPSRFKEEKYCAGDYTEIDGTSLCTNHPVENVSWNDVQLFIFRLNERDAWYRYRLPTEAEWEYAARGLKFPLKLPLKFLETNTAYSFGDHPALLSEYGWFVENSEGESHAVATRKANLYGLYDMHGNVREWTLDVYSGDYSKALSQEKAEDLLSPQSDHLRHVIRGGSWRVTAEFCRSAYRHRGKASYRPINGDVGFRLVRGEK